MKLKKIPIAKIISTSFNFIFLDFSKKIKKGFFAVFLITFFFNLSTSSLATNFTILLFVFFSTLLMSSVGISIHKEILEKKEQDYFLDFLSVKNFKYCFAITAITLISISPLIFHYLFKSFGKNALFNLSISFLFMLWIFSSAFALRFIFILPKIALNKKIKPYLKQMNHEGFQFLGLFVVVTIIFFIPSSIILSLQISLSSSNAQFFTFIKPLFDFVSFYISYFNYLIIFAAISYSYKIENTTDH